MKRLSLRTLQNIGWLLLPRNQPTIRYIVEMEKKENQVRLYVADQKLAEAIIEATKTRYNVGFLETVADQLAAGYDPEQLLEYLKH